MTSLIMNMSDNYDSKNSNLFSDFNCPIKKSRKCHLKKRARNITPKSKDDFDYATYTDDNSKTEPKNKNENKNKNNSTEAKIIKINIVSSSDKNDTWSNNPFDSFNSIPDKENQQPNIPRFKATQDYYLEIDKDSKESIIPCKPMLNSTSSKAYMEEYSKSKKYQEDKLNLFLVSTAEDTTEVPPYPPAYSKEKLILTSVSSQSPIFEVNQNKEDSLNDDMEIEDVLKYQESHLPVPLNKKDDENFKILTMKKMKRKTMPPNKSVRKFAEDKEPLYEKEFRIQNNFCKLLKRKVVHSLRRIYSSNFVLKKGNKKYDFMIFRDKDIGVYEYWQAHIHEAQNDEDFDTDEEQKKLAKCYTIGEIKEALIYIRDKNFQDCFINFNRYKKFRNIQDNEDIVNQIWKLKNQMKL